MGHYRQFSHQLLLAVLLAFEFDSNCQALWGAWQFESNSNASFRRRFPIDNCAETIENGAETIENYGETIKNGAEAIENGAETIENGGTPESSEGST